MEIEIKFRAWHKAEEKMCEVNLLRPGVGAFLVGLIEEAEQIVNIDDKSYMVTPRDWTPGRFCDVAEFELMQFTGLHDKNGKEIYERDILAFVQEKNFVKGHIHPFVIEWKDYGNGMVGWSQFSPIDMVEVIGNIYENSDLLTPSPNPKGTI